MTLEEFYAVMEQEEQDRQKCPCCENCLNAYTEYGYHLCKVHDMPLENEKEKCDDWK